MLAGEIPEEEMKKVFNLGIGYCIVVPEESENDAHDTIDAFGYKSWTVEKLCYNIFVREILAVVMPFGRFSISEL